MPSRPVYLREARRRRRWTQTELATRAKVRQVTISKLERNARARPKFDTVLRLAAALGVDPARLRCGPALHKVAV